MTIVKIIAAIGGVIAVASLPALFILHGLRIITLTGEEPLGFGFATLILSTCGVNFLSEFIKGPRMILKDNPAPKQQDRE